MCVEQCMYLCGGEYIWRLTHHPKATITGAAVTIKITSRREKNCSVGTRVEGREILLDGGPGGT